MNIWGFTHQGKVRKNNQDAYYIWSDGTTGFAMVCDGMGGAKAGNVASTMAAEEFAKVVSTVEGAPDCRLNAALNHANRVVYRRAQEDPACSGMGTTLVAILAHEDKAYVLNVGDSRAYHVYLGGVRKVTRDHSLVEDLLLKGELTPEEARAYPYRNVITRAIGVDEHVDGDIFVQKLKPGEKLLLCSDGLSNLISEQELFEQVNSGTPESVCRRLVELALDRGAPDNVTVVLLITDDNSGCKTA